ncbi:uncharacterized protein LOC110452007 isoform X3 [Mizuhopecten yessoensis]|uniref:uncharacterized protein LOC110452007 isoform X3 n=1 Tax=Mizuhopecten yessoensis TaxID=6573 RepID=UPI000B45DF3E|nr:uncharacterized protein LOC110452007 isoform X3 [Mizuhopecten yessoensis]
MNGHPDSKEDNSSKTHIQSFPSDYSDVQPSNYDAEFISEISNKMQVPHNLGPNDEVCDPFGYQPPANDVGAHHMIVPDRIFLAGEGQHIGAKENLRLFDPSELPPPQTVPYVGMMTPPRTLTLEEQGFPGMDIKDEAPKQESSSRDKAQQSHNYNGSAVQLEPYTPGISMNESLLLNEEDETTLLKTHVAKLTRKVTLLEEDNIRRSNYEKVLFPFVFGWSIWKVVSVFWSLMRPRHY